MLWYVYDIDEFITFKGRGYNPQRPSMLRMDCSKWYNGKTYHIGRLRLEDITEAWELNNKITWRLLLKGGFINAMV